jgi:hypothetical protein
VLPFTVEAASFGASVSCPLWTTQGRVGCIDYLVYTEADCNAYLPKYGTPRWMRSVANKGECLAYGTLAHSLDSTKRSLG